MVIPEEEINEFFRNLRIITSHGNELILIDKDSPRIYRISKKAYSRLRKEKIMPSILRADYQNLKRWSYLPSDGVAGHNPDGGYPAVLSLRVSENCNLKCRYCYNKDNALNTNGLKYMSLKTAQRAIDFFISWAKKDEMEIIFFGGEPLLNYPTIKEVINYAKSKKNKGITFKLATNATIMNREILRTILKNNVKIMVSIDFPPSEHDRNRPFKDGTGSFDLVKKNVMLLSREVPAQDLLLRSTVASDSGVSLTKIYESFYKAGIPSVNFITDFEFGNKINQCATQRQKKSIIRNQRKFLINNAKASSCKKEIFDQTLYVIVEGRQRLMECVALNNAVTVTTNGDIYLCHLTVKKKEFFLGTLEKVLLKIK